MYNKLTKNIIIILFLLLLISFPIVSATRINYTYHNNGNLETDNNYFYEYDSFNRLSNIKDGDSTGSIIAEYFYDDSGQRIKKIDYIDGQTYETYYINSEYILSGENTEVYISDSSNTIASISNEEKKFYHPNHIGSTDVVTDKNGDLIAKYEYLPFGDSVNSEGERFTFTGKEQDNSTNLHYFESRYYSSQLRRFVQPDNMIPNIYDPQQINRYAYARNNPVIYNDPSGHWLETALDIVSLGMSIKDIADDPTSVMNWVALGADVATLLLPGIAAGGMIVKGTVKGVSKVDNVVDGVKFVDKVKDTIKSADKIKDVANSIDVGKDIKKVPIDSLFGHRTDDAASLFRKGAKSHIDEPISILQVGKKNIISDGVGRSMRAAKNGDKFVYAKSIDLPYASIDDLEIIAGRNSFYSKAYYTDQGILDPKRWDQLGLKVPKK